MTNFTSTTIKKKSDKYGYETLKLKVSGYEGQEQRMFQVVHNRFDDTKVYTYKTLKGALKKYNLWTLY